MRRCLAFPLTFLLIGLASAAHAQSDGEAPPPDAEARAMFEAGQLAFADGRYEDALEMFTRAHRQAGRVELLYNIGLCHDRLGHDAEAAQAYRDYLEARPDVENRNELERRIELLEEQVSQQAEPQLPPPDPQPAETSGGGSAAPWVVLGLGVAAAVAGAVLLGLSVAASDRVNDARGVDWSTVRGDYDDAVTFSAVGIAMLGVGGAAMLIGIVWGAVDAGSSTEVAIGPGSIHVRGQF